MGITYINETLRVNGKKVATLSDTEFTPLRDALFTHLTRPAAVLLALSVLGEATTGEVADTLGMDRSNVYRLLCALAEEGSVSVVAEAHNDGKRGRPTHIWKVS